MKTVDNKPEIYFPTDLWDGLVLFGAFIDQISNNT